MIMEELVLEIGVKLDKNFIYYHDVLIKNGLRLDFFLYYT